MTRAYNIKNSDPVAALPRPFLRDLTIFSAWLVAIVLIVLALGAVANASPVHHDRSRHVSQSLRHGEARHASPRRHHVAEADGDHSGGGFWSRFSSGGSLVAEARSQIGNGAVYGRGSLWCARFVNWVLAHTGRSGTGSDAAASFAHYGQKVAGPQPGAIAVMSRKGGGHVGIVSGVDANGNPIVISGNNGGRVREAAYPRGRVYAYVVPN
jgi:uncharacterized protein (TIGR02594 family)